MANLCIKTPSSAIQVLIFQLLVLRPRPKAHTHIIETALEWILHCIVLLLFGNIGLFVLSRFHAFPFRALPPHAPCPAYGPHCPLNKPQAPISQMHLLFRPRISFLGPDTNHKNQSLTQHHVLSAQRLRQPGNFSGFLLIDYVNLNISNISFCLCPLLCQSPY